jgi:glycine dehydrogenase subunit 1
MANDEIVRLPLDPRGAEDIAAQIDDETSCVVVQSPDFFGNLRDLEPIAAAAHAKGALLVAVFTEAVSLGAVRSPGEMDADIVVGEGQSIGNALNFGGPYVGLFATRLKNVRQMPGRLAGETVDADGRRSFVLTLSTREQHIRREKATSNICTNSGLCALAFSIHLTLLGETGLRRVAALNHAAAVDLAERLGAIPGVSVLNDAFFNEFTIRTPRDAAELIDDLAARGIIGGLPVARLAPRAGLDDLIVVAATEVSTPADRQAYAEALAQSLQGGRQK